MKMEGNKNVQMPIMQTPIREGATPIQISNQESNTEKERVANKKRNSCMPQMLFKG